MSKKAQSADKTPVPVKIFKPRTLNQTDCVISIAENVLTVITGVPGSGKSACAAGMAVSYLMQEKVAKIFVTRPMVQCGRRGGGIGFLVGDIYSKFSPFAMPILLELEYYLGKQKYKYYLDNGIIEVLPMDLARGRSLEDTFIILDEAQNATDEQLDMMVTRIGKGGVMVITGDLDQTDLPENEAGALEDFISDIEGLKSVGICKLGIEDIQRHPIVGHIIEARRQKRIK